MDSNAGRRAAAFGDAAFEDLVDGLCDWLEARQSQAGCKSFADCVARVDDAIAVLRLAILRELAATDAERRSKQGEPATAADYAACLDAAGIDWLRSRLERSTGGDDLDSTSPTETWCEASTPAAASPNSNACDSPETLRLSTAAPTFVRHVGPYVVERRIGHGGMGVVYEARRPDIDRRVALKVMKDPQASEATQVRFDRERALLARLEHPNVARLLDVGRTAENFPYYAMEYVEGRRLDDWCDAHQLATRDRVALMIQVCRGIEAAHRVGIVHRDIKPANVLVSNEGVAKVLDFGLAKPLEGGGEFTASEQMLGTPSYMAPEQTGGRGHAIGPATDIYGLGGTLYRLLGGRAPFVGDAVNVIDQVLNAEPMPLRRLNPAIPTDLETICHKCLEKDPQRRYASAAALAEELDRFLDGRPISARPVRAPVRVWKWCKRRPLPAIALASAGIASMAAVGFFGRSLALQRANLLNLDKLAAGQNASNDEYTKVHEMVNRLDATFPAERRLPMAPAFVRAGMFREVQGYYAAAIEIWTQLADQFPDEPQFRRTLLDRSLDLGRVYRLDNRLDKSARAWEAGMAHATKLAELTAFDPAATYAAARLPYNLAVQAFDAGNYERSLRFAEATLSLADPVFDPSIAKQEPDFRWYVIASEYIVGKSQLRLGDAASANRHLERACGLAADKMLQTCRAVQAAALASLGEVDRATAQADAMTAGDPKNMELAYFAAEAYAIAANQAAMADRGKLLGKAKTHFRNAVANGLLDDDAFRSEALALPSLQVVRREADIAALIAAKAPKKK